MQSGEPNQAELILYAADRLSSNKLGIDIGVKICTANVPLAGWEFTINNTDGLPVIHSFTDKEGSYRGRKVLDVEVGTHYKLLLVLRDSIKVADSKIVETEEDLAVLKAVNLWLELWHSWISAQFEGDDLSGLYCEAACEWNLAAKWDEFLSSARQKEQEAKNRQYEFDSLVQIARTKEQKAWDATLYVSDSVTRLQKNVLEIENRISQIQSKIKEYQRVIERAKKQSLKFKH